MDGDFTCENRPKYCDRQGNRYHDHVAVELALYQGIVVYYCGDVNHLTSFAVLTGGQPGDNDPFASTTNLVIWILSLSFCGVFLVVGAILVLLEAKVDRFRKIIRGDSSKRIKARRKRTRQTQLDSMSAESADMTV